MVVGGNGSSNSAARGVVETALPLAIVAAGTANDLARTLDLRRGHVWSYDFVEDQTHNGRKFRMLNIVDAFSRECLPMLDDGRELPIEALYLAPRSRLNSAIAEQLGCALDDGPFGPI